MGNSQSRESLVESLVKEGFPRSLCEKLLEIDRKEFIPTSVNIDDNKSYWNASSGIHQNSNSFYAKILQNLELKESQSFLNIGSGTGYFSFLVAKLTCQNGINHGIEINANLVQLAKAKLKLSKYQDVRSVVFRTGDAFDLDPRKVVQKYDRIYVGAVVESDEAVEQFRELLNVKGIMVLINKKRQLMRITRSLDNSFKEKIIEEGIKQDYHIPLKENPHCTWRMAKSIVCGRDGNNLDFNKINVAVVGVAGEGKSSLINALRGVHDEAEPLFANVSEVGEGTLSNTSYNYRDNKVLWDIPGGNTPNHPEENYVINQKVLGFDFGIIVYANRIKSLVKSLVLDFYQAGIPFVIVRTKADSDLDNIILRDDLQLEEGINALRGKFQIDLEEKSNIPQILLKNIKCLLVSSNDILNGKDPLHFDEEKLFFVLTNLKQRGIDYFERKQVLAEQIFASLVQSSRSDKLMIRETFLNIDRQDFIIPPDVDYDDEEEYFDGASGIHLNDCLMYAKVLEHLKLSSTTSLLNIGSGSGYFSCLAATIIGRKRVNHGIDLKQDLVRLAQNKLMLPKYEHIDFTVFREGDAFNLERLRRKYDRIYVGASLVKEKYIEHFQELLANDGRMVLIIDKQLLCVTRSSSGFQREMIGDVTLSYDYSLVVPRRNMRTIADSVKCSRTGSLLDRQVCNIAVTGIPRTGKSTFINSIRNIHDADDPSYATVSDYGGETCNLCSYNFSDKVLWDIPFFWRGAEAENAPYFVFDLVIVVYEKSVSQTLKKILQDLIATKTSFVTVRSKMDIDVQNLMKTQNLPKEEAKAEIRKTFDLQIKELAQSINLQTLPESFLVSMIDLTENINDYDLHRYLLEYKCLQLTTFD